MSVLIPFETIPETVEVAASAVAYQQAAASTDTVSTAIGPMTLNTITYDFYYA